MRRSISLNILGAGIALTVVSATAQIKPGRVVAAQAAPATMPGMGDGRAEVAISFERMVLSDDLRAAVKAHDDRKADDILMHLGAATSPGGPVNQVLCPPPNVTVGGRCTLPYRYYIDWFTENAK